MFIVIDGPDGSGKTTAAKLLVQRLNENGRPAVFTSEPTKSDYGVKIRRILSGEGDRRELAELFVADRAAHIRDFVLPQQSAGNIVVCDRYRCSTVCYQYLSGDEQNMLIDMNRDFPSPDITFILNTNDAALLYDRIGGRDISREIYESMEYLSRAIREYKNMNRYFPKDFIVSLDCAAPAQTSVDKMLEILYERFDI